MLTQQQGYGIRREIELPYSDVVERTRQALSDEGFGVLTEIDVHATLKQKLDVDFRPYIIIGACNPPLAHQALSAERDIGLLLPCNLIVYAGDDEGTSVVAALDPVEQPKLTGNEGVEPVAEEVRARLERVVEAVAVEPPHCGRYR